MIGMESAMSRFMELWMRGSEDRAVAQLLRAAEEQGVKVHYCDDHNCTTPWSDVETAFREFRDKQGDLADCLERLYEEPECEWDLGPSWSMIAACIAAVGVAVGLVVWWFWSREPQVNDEAYSNTDKGARRINVEAYNTTDKGAKRVNIESGGSDEACVDGNAYELARAVQKNLYVLEQKVEGEWVKRLQVFFIFGRIAIVNRHLMRAMTGPGDTEWRIRSQHNPVGFLFKQRQLVFAYPRDEGDELKDLMLVEFPPCVNQHRDMRSHIIERADMGKFTSLGRVSMVAHDARSSQPVITIKTSDKLVAHDSWYSAAVDGAVYRRMRNYYSYGCDTERGECGGVVIVNDPSFTRKIVAIHSGGVKDDTMPAIAQPISMETVNAYLAYLHVRSTESLIAVDVTGTDQCDAPDDFSNQLYVGRDSRPVYTNGKSNIYKSVIADQLWTPVTRPAHLAPFVRDGEIVRPMVLAREKVALRVNPILDEVILNECVNDVEQMISTADLGVVPVVRSWEVAIAGVPGDALFPPLNRRTSPGYGWDKSGGGKAQYFGRDQEYIFDHPGVLRVRDLYMSKLERGERLCVKWEDSLKDERRPIAKVQSGKTRMFSVGCQVFTVIFRQYFMAFIAQTMRGRIDNEIAVGVNVYSFDWHRIATRMQSRGLGVLAGDFANYDGTLCAEIMWRVLDVIEAFYRRWPGYDPNDAVVRRCLWSDVVYSIHVNGTECYEWTHSNPSGCPITTILNSVYHCIAARYVYLSVGMVNGQFVTMKTYREHIAFICYGDDDVWNVSDEIHSWFNMETITEGFALLGMTYTDELKLGEVSEYRRLDEIKFLKRWFLLDHVTGRYRAPLDIAVIREMPCWIRGKRNQWELCAEVLEEAAEELALHPRSVFNEVMVRFRAAQAVLATRVPCRLLTYDGYQMSLLERATK